MGTDKLKSWRDSLISDKTNLLIDASRRCLGPIKTPFNKHELAAGLEAYLRKSQTAEMIVNMLDSTDLRILALIKHTGSISYETLAFFSAEKPDNGSVENAKSRINALRERLIVFTNATPHVPNAITINPILEGILDAELPLSRIISKAKPQIAEANDRDYFTDLCVFMSIAVHTKPFFGKASTLSKKATERFMATAPHILDESATYITNLYTALLKSGCLTESSSDKSQPKPRAFLDICEAFGERAELAILAAFEADDDSAVSIGFMMDLLQAVVVGYPRDSQFSATDTGRIILVIIYPLLSAYSARRNLRLDLHLPPIAMAVMHALKCSRLLEPRDSGLCASANMERLARRLFPDSDCPPSAPAGPKVIIEDSHEIRIMPEAVNAERAFVSALSRIEKTGLVWNFTLDKEAALSAFAFGFGSEEISGQLERMSGRKLSQSMRFSLESWEKEFNAVRLRSGVVAILDDHLSLVLEHNPKAEGLVREKLAAGVFLIDALNLQDAERKLKKLGIHADLRGNDAQEGEPGDSPVPMLTRDDISDARSVQNASAVPAKPIGDFLRDKEILPDADKRVQETIRRLLMDLLALKLDPSIEEMLADRIKSRLITSKDQMLNNELAGSGKVGALDYPGKVRLVERAYKEGVPVEITWPGEGNSVSTAKGIVRQMNKAETGLELVLGAQDGLSGGEKQITVAIRSISGVRIIQNFLFGENNGITSKD